MTETEELLTIKDVCELTGTHYKVIKQAIEGGELRVLYLTEPKTTASHRKIRITASSYNAWIYALEKKAAREKATPELEVRVGNER
jgi:hypothetical protein|tara:strand:- start:4978 stop:5235 length:258 start_codon:yes stop_codon:yes gene_type:complete